MEEVQDKNEVLERAKEIIAIIDKHCEDTSVCDQKLLRLVAAYYGYELSETFLAPLSA